MNLFGVNYIWLLMCIANVFLSTNGNSGLVDQKVKNNNMLPGIIARINGYLVELSKSLCWERPSSSGADRSCSDLMGYVFRLNNVNYQLEIGR